MKTKLTNFLIAILFFAKAYATVRTVNNTNAGAGQYLQLDAAIIASNPGDTIYVSKSATAYASFTISKSITIIGPGTFAQTQIPFGATLNQVTINSNISNITLKGLKIFSTIVNATTNVHQLTISDNYFGPSAGITFSGISNCSDFIISNNIFTSSGDAIYSYNTGGSFNFIVENNIFAQSKITAFNFPNGLIQNNTFCNTNGGNAFGNFNAVPSGLLIKNNIFYNSHPSNNTSSCTFLNNITYSTTVTYPVLGGTNIDNTDPLFMNVATSGAFSINYNYDLQSSSLANNAGTDGTDLGYYGGTTHVSILGEPQNVPVIRAMDIPNNNIPLNGNVNVKVLSTKAR